MIHVLTVNVGDKYSPRYVINLNNALKRNCSIPFQLHCMTDGPRSDYPDDIKLAEPLPIDLGIKLQWNKVAWHSVAFQSRWGIGEGSKCIILDIDQLVVGNIDDLFRCPISDHQVAFFKRWWSYRQNVCNINGGVQLFIAGHTDYIFSKFIMDVAGWQDYYISRRLAKGPVNGEQNFLDETVMPFNKYILPDVWIGKYESGMNRLILQQWIDKVDREDPYEPYFCGGEFHPDVKLVHFAGTNNMIHEYDEDWISYYWN